MQIVLLLLAVIAVPWMLFPKPFILKKLHSEVPLLLALCMIARKFIILLTKYLFYINIYVYACLWFEFLLFDCKILQELVKVSLRTVKTSIFFQMNMLTC